MSETKNVVSPTDFVLAVQKASSFKDLAEKTGLQKSACISRYNSYVKKGVQLKSLRVRNNAKLNVEALNKLIETNPVN
jgi:hypothetical protein